MNTGAFSRWDRIQLAILRWLSVILTLTDALLNVHWGERLLGRLTGRWQSEVAQLERALARLEEERHLLHQQIEAIAVHTAVIYLIGRHQSRGQLRFDPSVPRDDKILDASIDTLVKERLAAIDSQETAPGHFVYTLEPDWIAIRAVLTGVASRAQPQLAEWLREGVSLIDRHYPQVGGA